MESVRYAHQGACGENVIQQPSSIDNYVISEDVYKVVAKYELQKL